MTRSRQLLLLAVLLLAVCAAYANHFQNGFHFDDAHTVVDNPQIRSLRHLPDFFRDANTFSVLSANRTYRPFVSASLALDYALAGGYHPFWFHLSTFLVYLLQLIACYALYKAILQTARPALPGAACYAALLATAWYGLHPAMAETVNYIIQRGDIFCTAGVVAALALFVRWPGLRRTGLYLLPFAFALLSKPPAAVLPLLLYLYLILFEAEGKGRYLRAALSALPSLVLDVLLLALQSAMTPKSYTPSILSAWSYRITQPYVLQRYFVTLFFPFHLNVDTDLQPVRALTPAALMGFLFLTLLLAAAWRTAQQRVLRPIAFGLLWFVIASLPTSLYRLSEVENDHRMFLPFVGLVCAVVWAGWLLLERAALQHKELKAIAPVVVVLLLALYGCGVYERNQVWRSDESLWRDDVQKCPHNGRGLMNYGLTQMAQGAYPEALALFEQALLYTPNYPTLEINLGVVEAALQHDDEAERHFLRAIRLAPADDETHFFYGRWLYVSGRASDALAELQQAVQLNPARLPAHELLATAYLALGDVPAARAAAAATLQVEPRDAAALALLAQPATPDANYWINASLNQYKRGNFTACIAAAQRALQLKPDSDLAYNNLGAAYAALQQWDQAIASERQALRINPGLTIAHNNLVLYLRQAKAGPTPAAMGAEDWLNASLRADQAGAYRLCIEDARKALQLRPDYPEAYNNIAAGYEGLHQWAEAIAAARAALRLKPDFQLAKNNLAWAQQEEVKAGQ